MNSKELLIVTNGTAAGVLSQQLLQGTGYRLHLVDNCDDARQLISTAPPEVILLGSPPHQHCLPSLDHLQEMGCDPAVIALLDANEEERYLDCHKQGALDCLMAPFSAAKLLKSIERCLAIKTLERQKRDFISMLSHDLKNPVTAAIGAIDLVREKRLGPLNREQAGYLQSAIESCNEVTGMIDNLLDLHRLEAGKMQFKTTRVNLLELLQKEIDRFDGTLKQTRINLESRLDPDLPELQLDRPKFQRVVANIMINAIKFTPSGGKITICCSVEQQPETGQLVKLVFSDTGSGISNIELPMIFDRFVQANNQGGRKSGGSGLGLAFCKLAVEAHGGTIFAKSLEGSGSEFTILLPVSGNTKGD